MILLLENNIRGGIRSIMRDRYKKTDKNKKILYVDAVIYMVILCHNPYLMMKKKFYKSV